MLRKIVKIDPEKCNGCGDCVPSCAEGAITIINGKAVLAAENLCDGLGACLGECPLDAITVEEREADEFDEVAVEKHLTAQGKPAPTHAPQHQFHSRIGHDFLHLCQISLVIAMCTAMLAARFFRFQRTLDPSGDGVLHEDGAFGTETALPQS